MIAQFLGWYLIVQLISLAALPLALRLFANLPDRGYVFAKSLGILLVGGLLWLGTSYGLLRNEAGGAWLALGLLAALSYTAGWQQIRAIWQERRLPFAGGWRYLLGAETLFLAAFLLWTFVRAYDPGINHTEQPMDLMFMTGIWTSPTFPPRDPWLAGYAISYYYFGYWLLTTLTHLTGQTPEIAYNLGQACWFGLLLLGSFGIGYNLLAAGDGRPTASGTRAAAVGGLLSAVAIGITGNLQGILEWLYAQGVNIDGLARFFSVRNFPSEARVTNLWHIDNGWWWWRSSRVLSDRTLLGDHIEVIDEFPIFSYILGDNHPHVLAMPFVLLVVALALNLFLSRPKGEGAANPQPSLFNPQSLLALIPFHLSGLLLLVVAAGGLIFFNTWDFPPYWLLLTLCALWVAKAVYATGRALWLAGALAVAVLVGAVIVYFPYFLTAQSQAGGVLPNFFNPTHLPQFLLMFGHFLLGLGSLLLLAWKDVRPAPRRIAIVAGLVLGLPILFLLGSLALANSSEAGRSLLQRMPLAPEMTSYPAAVATRWLARPWTFLLLGSLASLVIAQLWARFDSVSTPTASTPTGPGEADGVRAGTTFALLLAGIGLLLVYAPEFVYLRDNFGSRMNTVFKFYYQGWLLLGLAAVYGIVRSFQTFAGKRGLAVLLLGGLSLLLILAALIYPVAGVYTKANHFQGEPTLNGLAYVGADELAAIDWLRANTRPDALVLEGKGGSYRAETARLSAATGRATLLGWDGHESQWRGDAYVSMAQGRPEALEGVYRNSSAEQLRGTLAQWQIEYVVVGPAERAQYGIPPGVEDRLGRVMELAWQQGDFRIYRQRK
ncbi:MAG: hypothetical protein KF753_19690 [Caldilineaceae bacterium]|nr:hypothetical protein [Caldilineaceae bacterium]